MNKLLVVDDEKNIRLVIREYAEFNNFEVDEAADGEEAVLLATKKDYDIIVMDIMMPKLDGYSACKQIRKIKNTPIILLSARNEEYDKLFGFELGIDDYVVKPFSPKVLIARINAIIARHTADNGSATSKHGATADTQTFSGLKIDRTGRNVFVDGEKVDLTPKEFDLLCLLVDNQNTALSRETLLEEIWGYDFFGDDRTIDTHIKNLRNHIGPYRDFIKTLRGVGYKFEI